MGELFRALLFGLLFFILGIFAVNGQKNYLPMPW
jgi:hypothetical protein